MANPYRSCSLDSQGEAVLGILRRFVAEGDQSSQTPEIVNCSRVRSEPPQQIKNTWNLARTVVGRVLCCFWTTCFTLACWLIVLVPWLIMSYHVVSCRFLSYPVVPCRTLSCPVVPCRILSYPVVSCRILSYPAVFLTCLYFNACVCKHFRERHHGTDTLWLMGMKEEFWEARDWVRDKLSFDHAGQVSVFETTIRELGGLLSAYDLSEDPAFLKKVKCGENKFENEFVNNGD